ncbi:Ig-like domain repeat protein [Nocardioides sp. L-11A]|uniref:Ig-like domain repeat protein n=1 Tax=Nocardioides sp. L-11A TaxID=3043848 RepID=UPI002499B4B5|nr:Ig-like domain repeat protein [Nocardioides sp. L-11A]
MDLATSTKASAAVTDDGALHVWGVDSGGDVQLAPDDLTGAAAVSLIGNGGAVLKRDGSVVAWGANPAFKTVPSGLSAQAVSVSGQNVYAVTTDGTLSSWGTAHDPATNPAPPAGLTGLVDVSAAGALTLALDADGEISEWGTFVDLGLATTPPEIQGNVAQIATGGAGSAGAILKDGTIRVWGFTPPIPAPVATALTGKRVVALDVDGNALAVTEDGEVHAWGPTAAITDIPPSLDGEQVAAVSVSQYHAAAVVTDFHLVTPPVVTGTARVGQTLTAAPAVLSLEPDSPATGQWLADGDPIAGADDTALELDEDLIGSMISYRTTATRGSVDVESISTEVGPVTPATVASTTTLAVAPAAGGYGAARIATATVAAPDGTPTGSVTFTLDGKTTTAALSGGKAAWKLPADLSVGAHSLSASYAGDSATDPSVSTATTVAVSKAGSTLKAGKTKVKGKTKAMAKKAVLNLDVDTDTGTSAAGTVMLKLKAKGSKAHKVTVTVGADGVAKVKLKKLKRGTYKATWTYSGSATVDAGKIKVKVKV